ncbi:MAG TPA: hypothetical protein VGX24_15485 [Pyrinomonadaceae bacterium]|jgi:hypothetical protein|nr:hypothetical protein [Pyrinomonadaceae bacterium]
MNVESEARPRYLCDRELEELVESFESCTMPPAKFDHGAHLAVVLWYLSRCPSGATAAARMREGLHRFAAHNNAQGNYNETLTLFWLKLVGRFLARADAARPLAERANELLATYNSSKLAFEYYSRALVQTPEAKTSWVEPDLKPLDF